jgi:hypothetical protein
MTQTSTHTKMLRMLKGLEKRTLTGDDLFNEFRIKKFNFFSEVPGYIENGSFEPVSDKEFFDFARGWPANKLKMKLTDTPKETVLKTIRKKLESAGGDDNFRFLWELVPEEMQVEWEAEKNEKQKKKDKEKEEARLTQERIAVQWASLHPLNQEWGIPPPPAVVQPAGSHAITDWVRQYKPYRYECNGSLWRKKTTEREDCTYEKEETGDRGQGSEKTETERERERGGTKEGSGDTSFAKATAGKAGETRNETRRGVLPAREGETGTPVETPSAQVPVCETQTGETSETQTGETGEEETKIETETEREREKEETPEQRKKREKAERDAKFEIEYRKNHPLPPEPEDQPKTEPLYAIRVINPVSKDAQIQKIAEAMRRLR